jgi:hypothetical protein
VPAGCYAGLVWLLREPPLFEEACL